MKKLFTALFTALALVVLNTSVAFAAQRWGVKMSDPKETSKARTFNLEIVVLSTEADDRFVVELSQNGSVIASKTTTKDYGDSGVFPVTVPSDGSYTYFVRATLIGEGEVKTTPSQTVSVNTPSSGGPSTVTTTSSNSTSNGNSASTASTTQGGTSTDGNSAGGDIANTNNGQVGDDSTSSDQSQEDVLGAETNDNAADDKDNNNQTAWIVLAVLAVLGAAGYYWFYYRPNHKADLS